MRFAISLLTILSVASIIGTVLKQNEPYPSYVMEFGPFWFEVFEWLGLLDVYHSGWFLAILLFLVSSTALCIYRNTPGIIREIRSFRENASERSLSAFSHQATLEVPASRQAQISAELSAWLTGKHYAVKHSSQADGAIMLAAKTGSLQKLGYFLAHGAIVLICAGGLLDGNLLLKWQQMTGIKAPETRDLPQSKVPAISRLDTGNLSYRANINVPTGDTVDVAFLNAGNGYLVQELPFSLRLDRFHIEHYPTGQPKLFASDVTVTDKQTGRITQTTIKVNHPLTIQGVSIYQASFGDGGSSIELAQWQPLGQHTRPAPLSVTSLRNFAFQAGSQRYTLEMGDFRLFNIETIEAGPTNKPAALSDAIAVTAPKNTRNIGPSIQYKLRNQQGQAKEYLHYMQPVAIDGQPFFLFGVRRTPAEPFSFLRIPADEAGQIDGYMRLRAILLDPGQMDRLADKVADASGGPPTARQPFRQSIQWALERFAAGGFPEIERFLQEKVPADKRELVARTYVRLIQGVAVEAWQLAREQAGLPRESIDQNRFRFIVESLVAISSSFDYDTPVLLQMTGFNEVKASGFQITRSPGKNLVYLGSLLLVLGIFAMFYIKEKRLWLLVKGNSILFAMSANRKSSDFDTEFTQNLQQLQQLIRD